MPMTRTAAARSGTTRERSALSMTVVSVLRASCTASRSAHVATVLASSVTDCACTAVAPSSSTTAHCATCDRIRSRISHPQRGTQFRREPCDTTVAIEADQGGAGRHELAARVGVRDLVVERHCA